MRSSVIFCIYEHNWKIIIYILQFPKIKFTNHAYINIQYIYAHIYIYIIFLYILYIYIYIIIDKRVIYVVRKSDFSKEANYLFRKYVFLLEDMTFPKKVNYLIRKYDLVTQGYAKVTPTWDELTFVECFWGKQFKKVSPRGRPNS